MGDTNRGASFYIYNSDYRFGIRDSEIGPGCCEIVYDEYIGEKWVTIKEIGPVEFADLQALAEATKLMQAWEDDSAPPKKITVVIEETT